MANLDSINNLNFYTAFNSFVSGSLDPWMDYEMKPPEEYDWGDENGKEVDLSERFYKARDLKIDLVMEADSEAEFWQKYNLIRSTLKAPGLKRVYLHQLRRAFYVYCNKLTGFNGVNFKDGDICCTLTIEVTEPDPSFIEDIEGDTFFGPAVTLPISEEDLLALNAQDGDLIEVELETGLNRIFVVAVKPGMMLTMAFDQEINEDVTTEYQLSEITVSGIVYQVYTMEMAIPYTTNHIHLITLSNE